MVPFAGGRGPCCRRRRGRDGPHRVGVSPTGLDGGTDPLPSSHLRRDDPPPRPWRGASHPGGIDRARTMTGMQSGDRCREQGIYESTCEDRSRIALIEGRRFPTCRTHGDVEWTLLESGTTRTGRREPATPRDEPEWKTNSGERCRQTGLYESLCSERIRIAVMRGSRLPTCGNHGEVPWVLVAGRRF